MKSNISDERQDWETFRDYKRRIKLNKLIIKNYLRNGQHIEEGTEESNNI